MSLRRLIYRTARRIAAGLLLPCGAFASAVTFVTSLPVAQDQVVVRFNMQPAFSTRQLVSFQFPESISYGATAKLGLFATLNQGFESINSATPPGTARIANSGSGDTGLYARYTLFKRDQSNSTFRITPLAGAFVPTGNHSFTFEGKLQSKSLQMGSGTVDPYFGVAMGYQSKRWSSNWDATYRLNPVTSTNFTSGSELRLDGQWELKVAPIRVPEEGLPHQMNLSLESNYYKDRRDHLNGILSPNSGGQIFRESALLELSGLRWQFGGGIQMPLLQELNGTGRVKQKVGYLLFFEYYLAAPVWRKRA